MEGYLQQRRWCHPLLYNPYSDPFYAILKRHSLLVANGDAIDLLYVVDIVDEVPSSEEFCVSFSHTRPRRVDPDQQNEDHVAYGITEEPLTEFQDPFKTTDSVVQDGMDHKHSESEGLEAEESSKGGQLNGGGKAITRSRKLLSSTFASGIAPLRGGGDNVAASDLPPNQTTSDDAGHQNLDPNDSSHPQSDQDDAHQTPAESQPESHEHPSNEHQDPSAEHNAEAPQVTFGAPDPAQQPLDDTTEANPDNTDDALNDAEKGAEEKKLKLFSDDVDGVYDNLDIGSVDVVRRFRRVENYEGMYYVQFKASNHAQKLAWIRTLSVFDRSNHVPPRPTHVDERIENLALGVTDEDEQAQIKDDVYDALFEAIDIPEIMLEAMHTLIDYIEDYGMLTRNLFRDAGSLQERRALLLHLLTEDPKSVPPDLSADVAQVAADTLKILLRRCPESILTNALLPFFLGACTEKNKVDRLLALVNMMPVANQELLLRLCTLMEGLSKRADKTGMEIKSLAIVLGPNFLIDDTEEDLKTVPKTMVPLFETLIDNMDLIFYTRIMHLPLDPKLRAQIQARAKQAGVDQPIEEPQPIETLSIHMDDKSDAGSDDSDQTDLEPESNIVETAPVIAPVAAVNDNPPAEDRILEVSQHVLEENRRIVSNIERKKMILEKQRKANSLLADAVRYSIKKKRQFESPAMVSPLLSGAAAVGLSIFQSLGLIKREEKVRLPPPDFSSYAGSVWYLPLAQTLQYTVHGQEMLLKPEQPTIEQKVAKPPAVSSSGDPELDLSMEAGAQQASASSDAPELQPVSSDIAVIPRKDRQLAQGPFTTKFPQQITSPIINSPLFSLPVMIGLAIGAKLGFISTNYRVDFFPRLWKTGKSKQVSKQVSPAKLAVEVEESHPITSQVELGYPKYNGPELIMARAQMLWYATENIKARIVQKEDAERELQQALPTSRYAAEWEDYVLRSYAAGNEIEPVDLPVAKVSIGVQTVKQDEDKAAVQTAMSNGLQPQKSAEHSIETHRSNSSNGDYTSFNATPLKGGKAKKKNLRKAASSASSNSGSGSGSVEMQRFGSAMMAKENNQPTPTPAIATELRVQTDPLINKQQQANNNDITRTDDKKTTMDTTAKDKNKDKSLLEDEELPQIILRSKWPIRGSNRHEEATQRRERLGLFVEDLDTVATRVHDKRQQLLQEMEEKEQRRAAERSKLRKAGDVALGLQQKASRGSVSASERLLSTDLGTPSSSGVASRDDLELPDVEKVAEPLLHDASILEQVLAQNRIMFEKKKEEQLERERIHKEQETTRLLHQERLHRRMQRDREKLQREESRRKRRDRTLVEQYPARKHYESSRARLAALQGEITDLRFQLRRYLNELQAISPTV